MGLPISICIPTYNRAPLLRRTLDHLKTCQDVFSELVISDNASSDDTPSVTAAAQREFARVKLIRRAANHGVYRNIHGALSAATRDYAFVLSDDDALIAENIARAFATLTADPECIAVYGGYERCDADLTASYGAFIPPEGRFTRADKIRFSQHAKILTFPIVRREIIQRHWPVPAIGSGTLPLMAQLLDWGTIQLVPYALYRHADTADRMEARATEAEYHDFLRADWEIYLASVGPVDFAMASRFVAGQTVQIYLAGADYARAKDLPLLERTFLLRYLAYAFRDDEKGSIERVDQWERTRLVAAAVALLQQRLDGAEPVARLVAERGRLNLPAMLTRLAETWRPVPVVLVEPEELVDWADAAGDFVIAEYWRTLEARRARHGVDPARHVAMADLIASLRLPGSPRTPLLHGPSGSPHFYAG
jgi:glycosyltransferase involved in cell wall biosynthesis